MANPFSLPVILMLIVLPFGAIDTAYYHFWKFRLYRQPSARWETATHLVRGVLFGTGLWILLRYQPQGGWYWGVGSLFVIDFFNALADVFLEPASRAPLGGLPRMEYVLHMIGGTFSGAIAASFFLAGSAFHDDPTRLTPLAPGVWTPWMSILGYLAVAGIFGGTLLETILWAFHGKRPFISATPQPINR